ncbi:MAG: hypothetical protein IPQ07_01515 [Myxococcales bacterium]|nr:hypothetical protein [Myxococcales bacterium]
MAFLNGVNADIRNQYANRPMAELQIPRHIEAHVAGAMPNFTINVDESGVVTPPRHAESAWLRARAVAAHPEHGGLDHSTQRMLREQQLLHELVADEIKGKM